MRYENKFVLPLHAYPGFLAQLRTSRFFFSEIYHERRVNNIYLDTKDYKNLFDNFHGLQNREKHRIRWYGSEKSVEKPILEYKIKHGEMGYKEYFNLPRFSFDGMFDFGALLDSIHHESKENLPQYKAMYHDILVEVPTLYNTYLRRYFLSADGNYRLTLDKDLDYKMINRWFNGLTGFSENKLVIELKYERNNIRKAGEILQELGLRLSRNSKYLVGMQGIYYNLFE